MIRAALLALVLGLAATPGHAQCRQALALGLDVSGSVDAGEYRLQLDGLAGALMQPDVVHALLSDAASPVHLAIFEWSGPEYQRILVNWTAINDRTTLAQIATRLTNHRRTPAPPGTALGSAMLFGAALLAARPDCWKYTLDISGDGKHNFGPHPRDIRKALLARTFTLNALVIGAETGSKGRAAQTEISGLSAYFSAWVITGPGAFVQTAIGFKDYKAAMTRKLLRELEGLAISDLRGNSR